MEEKRLKVLIVEDQVSEILPVKVLLEELNCDVEVGIDGTGAVEQLVQNRYDLLVLDWMMPDFNGDQALEYAQKLIDESGKELGSMPFVAYTGLETEEIEVPETKSFRCLAHWKKPFQVGELEVEIKQVLDTLRERQ